MERLFADFRLYCIALVLMLAGVSCDTPLIDAQSSMPGAWRVESITHTSHEGWAYLPFDIDDEVVFYDDGVLVVYGIDGEYDGDWWVEEHFRASYLNIKLKGERETTVSRVKEVSGGRIVLSVYPQYWDGSWEGYPVYEVTLMLLSEY